MIYGAIFMGSGWQTFFDVASIALVLGGTTAALLVGFSLDEVKKALPALKGLFGYTSPDLTQYVDQFAELSRTARRDGLLALDRSISDLEDPFMAFGLQMAVDGIEEDAIENLMEQKAQEDLSLGRFGAKFLMTAGSYCPAFGMLGTLIGLIQMMQNLNDPSQIGAGMAVALVTTFYGALFANLIFLPLGDKINGQVTEQRRACEMIQTGVLAIVQGDGPSMVEKRLRLFLSGDADQDKGGDAELAKAA